MIIYLMNLMNSQGAYDLKAYRNKVRALDRSMILSEESLDCVVKDLKQIAKSLNKENEVYEVEHVKFENGGRIELLRNGSPLNEYCVFYDKVRNLVYAENNHIVKDVELYALPDSKVDDINNQMLNLYSIEL